jgi:hypothetical protein
MLLQEQGDNAAINSSIDSSEYQDRFGLSGAAHWQGWDDAISRQGRHLRQGRWPHHRRQSELR